MLGVDGDSGATDGDESRRRNVTTELRSTTIYTTVRGGSLLDASDSQNAADMLMTSLQLPISGIASRPLLTSALSPMRSSR